MKQHTTGCSWEMQVGGTAALSPPNQHTHSVSAFCSVVAPPHTHTPLPQQLLSSSYDGTLKQWDTHEGTLEHTWHVGSPVESMVRNGGREETVRPAEWLGAGGVGRKLRIATDRQAREQPRQLRSKVGKQHVCEPQQGSCLTHQLHNTKAQLGSGSRLKRLPAFPHTVHALTLGCCVWCLFSSSLPQVYSKAAGVAYVCIRHKGGQSGRVST